MLRWKDLFQRIPQWGRSALLFLFLFAVLALGLPHLVELALQLSRASGSVTVPTQASIPVMLTPAVAYPPICVQIGQQWISPADGMTLVCVPAGNFSMGAAAEDGKASADEKPQHTVYLDAFWIDKTDVTNGEYALCVAAGGCEQPISKQSFLHDDYFAAEAYRNFPVVDVSWEEANQYCLWADRTLPSEAEWEKAARGTDRRLYPWGNKVPNDTLLNFDTALGDTSAVCQYPAGNSPYGVCDMAGNVWQWVADWYSSSGYSTDVAMAPKGPAKGSYKVFKGSQWGSPVWAVFSSIRRWRRPDLWSFNLGFRCASPSP